MDLERVRFESAQYPLGCPNPGGWAMSDDTCRFLGQLVRSLKPQRVIEFGSGFSSRVIADELVALGAGHLDSIDHFETWSSRARESLPDQDSHVRVSFHTFPLRVRRYHGWPCVFYSIPASFYKEKYDLAVVDGPPHLVGRDGALLEVFDRLGPGGVVFADDGDSGHMRSTLAKWIGFFGDAIRVTKFADIGRGIALIEKTAELPPGASLEGARRVKEWVRTIRNRWRTRRLAS